MPRVSVCIPAYEQPEFFNRALASVLGQDFEDFEVVVTDDSRGDEIREIANDAGDSRVRYVKNDARLGSPANWNAAVERAEGELVKFIHHDDWLTSNGSLRAFVELLDCAPDAQLAFSASMCCGPDGLPRRIHSPSTQIARLRDDPHVLLFGNWIGAPSSTIYRRAVNARFDERLKWVVDIDFYLAVLAHSPVFAYSGQALVSVTEDAAHQVTNEVALNPELELQEWFLLYAKWAPRLPIRGERARFLGSLLRRLDDGRGRHGAVGLDGRAARLYSATRLLRRFHVLG